MLNKKSSNKNRVWKFSVILPTLVVFFMAFQVKTIAQEKEAEYAIALSYSYFLEASTTDKELKELEESFVNDNLKLKISDIRRNNQNQIVAIKLTLKKGANSERVYSKKLANPINTIEIYVGDGEDYGFKEITDTKNLKTVHNSYSDDKSESKNSASLTNSGYSLSYEIESTHSKDNVENNSTALTNAGYGLDYEVHEAENSELENSTENVNINTVQQKIESSLMNKKIEEINRSSEKDEINFKNNKDDVLLEKRRVEEKKVSLQGRISVTTKDSETKSNTENVDFRLSEKNDTFIISKKSTEETLKFYKETLAKSDCTMSYSGIKRNNNGEITGINLKLEKSGSELKTKIKQTEPISKIHIGFKNGDIYIGNAP